MLISNDMGIFRLIKIQFEDTWQKICSHWLKTLTCIVVALSGVIVGVVLFNIAPYSWWYFNRYTYAEGLFNGGFALLLSFVVSALFFYFCIVLCNLVPFTRYLSQIVLFVACLYCGANTAAAVVCWSLWGVMFAIFATFIEVVGYCLCCAVSLCEYPACRTLKEAFCELKICFWVLILALMLKIVGFFVILKILTAII